MTLLWNNPYSWETGNPVTADQMNEVNNNIRFLFAPPRKTVRVRATGTNQSIASATFVPLDPPTYAILLELTGLRDVEINLVGAVSNPSGSTLHSVDFLVDNFYASSMTATPLTNGVWANSQDVSSLIISVNAKIILPKESFYTGVHTFTPYIKTSSGTLTWYEASGIYSEFTVREIG